MWLEMRRQLDDIYRALADEESKEWFDARIKYMVDGNSDDFICNIEKIRSRYQLKWENWEIERALSDKQNIVIYGCGHDGRIAKRNLEMAGYDILCWCDSNTELQNQFVDGKKVISPEELSEKYNDCLVIIGSSKYETGIRTRLCDVNFPVKNIFRFLWGQAINTCGEQYFDVFSPLEREIFVDAGAYNGDTIQGFMKWKGDNNYKAYAIELSKSMCEVIKNRKIPNIEVINAGAWNKNEDLVFSDDLRGAVVSKAGSERVQGRTIDSIVEGNEVTFIKMDIEGAELNALVGAGNTIRKYKPRLAVCIYHKRDDILKLGSVILNLNPDYKLYIRHYTSCMWETVLYAV